MVRLDDDARRLLDGANYGHLATLMADGSPKVEPVWVGREGDRVLVTAGVPFDVPGTTNLLRVEVV